MQLLFYYNREYILIINIYRQFITDKKKEKEEIIKLDFIKNIFMGILNKEYKKYI